MTKCIILWVIFIAWIILIPAWIGLVVFCGMYEVLSWTFWPRELHGIISALSTAIVLTYLYLNRSTRNTAMIPLWLQGKGNPDIKMPSDNP